LFRSRAKIAQCTATGSKPFVTYAFARANDRSLRKLLVDPRRDSGNH